MESLIDEYSKKVEKEGADVAILAISGYKIPQKYLEEKYREELLEKDHVIIWDYQLVEYYEDIVKALGVWAVLIREKLPGFASKDKKDLFFVQEIESGEVEKIEKIIKDFFPKLGKEIVGELRILILPHLNICDTYLKKRK